MTLVQLFDGIIGFRLNDPSRAYGPLVFSALNLGTVLWMNRATAAHDSRST
jgi:hypothetical protein